MVPQPSYPHPSAPEEEPEENLEALEPSKSQRKRDADDVRDFARLLTTLPPRKLKRLALPTDIEEAIKKCPPTSTRGAHKRHLQFISKLLRKNGDVEDIRSRLENPVAPKAKDQAHETMRDNLITAFADHVDSLRQQYPAADMQKVRQLVRQINAVTDITGEPTEESAKDQSARKKAQKAKKSLLSVLRESAQV